jgi:hypothetical protein
MLLPILLLVALIVIVIGANSMKRKGTMSDATFRAVLNVTSIVVTIAAVIILVRRLRA